ncbi:MAG: helix-turn-helix domain containing protein [Chitinivibrionales bacterium]|nr:helix-turn-helix domain containing protein [Chitinivibrionales bacterium]
MVDQKSIREQTVHGAKEGLILDAALKLFAEKGFHETRLEDIAAAAGFSKASLYNYYEDKEAIFINLVIRDFEKLALETEKSIAPDAPVLANLRRALKTGLTFFGDRFAFMLTMSNFRSMDTAAYARMCKHHSVMMGEFHKRFEMAHVIIMRILALARKRHEIATVIDDNQLSSYIESLLRGIMFKWKVQGKMGDLEKELDQALQFIAQGLGCKQKQ